MKRNVYFMIDNAIESKEKIKKKELNEIGFYGGYELEKLGKAKIVDSTFKDIFKVKRGSVIVTNRIKNIILLRLLGNKVILINMNSNHDLDKTDRSIKRILIRLFYKTSYRFCYKIICLSKIQVPLLNKNNIKRINVIPLGVKKSDFKKRKLSREYFLSSGGDMGKNHNFVEKALNGFKLRVLKKGTLVPYNEYLNILSKAKALILNIKINKYSSDLSGTTTCFEALMMKKPIFINELPWLEELFKDNYYVYKNEKDLRELCKKNIKFKQRNYDHITFENFTTELNKIINSI